MTVLTLVTIGLLAGVIGAALGVGGGIVMVPGMVVLLAVAQHTAQGTSLVVIVPTAIVATAVHARAGRVDFTLAMWLALGGLGGGVLGAWTALGLDGLVLRRLFAVVLVLIAVRMLRSTRQSTPKATESGPDA
ncbi:MAG: sulfite exporter TauE/SafE family protein [Acidimicrobiia bacterium]